MSISATQAVCPRSDFECVVGRSGRLVRFVVGSAEFPEVPFPVAGTPRWQVDESTRLTLRDHRFALDVSGGPLLAGTASVRPYAIDIEVGDAEVLGFGAATGGANRNQSRFRVMTRDTLLYGIEGAAYSAFPFFVAREGQHVTGVLLATPHPLDVVVAGGSVSIRAAGSTDGAPVDVIVSRGTAREVVCNFAELTGRGFLPPAWALGFHQSRWSYRTQDAVLRVARRFRDLGLPADAIHLDIHYMDRYRVFTFSPRRFPRPRQMHEQLRTLGFRTMAIVDPGVSVARGPVLDVLQGADMLLRRRDGRVYEGRVWPGTTVFPDFLQLETRQAWARFHAPLIDAGVAGFWNDMNDPVFRMGERGDPLAEDVWHRGVPHRHVRNLYANAMAEATVAGLEARRPGRRTFVLSRSGFVGIQRHAAIWTGDNHSSWEHLRENLNMVLNLGLSGVPLSGADVGGFGRGPGTYGLVKPFRPSAELFVRWMELGALMPFFRVHSTAFGPSQEPWTFGKRALALSRQVLNRRYRLLPLLYRLALESHETGLPIVRPLFMHYDVRPGLGAEQFLLGDSVLVAPVLRQGITRREVWLPGGSWVDWNTGGVHQGDSEVSVAAPLGVTPLFLRAGTVLFLATPGRNAEETLRGPLAAEVTAPPAGQSGRGSLFLDDGESAAAARYLLDVTVVGASGQLCIRFESSQDSFTPVQRHVELRVPPDYRVAVIDGARRDLELRDLATEGRNVMAAATLVPIDARTVIVES